jgi:SOS response associated peptidase (SRAP)
MAPTMSAPEVRRHPQTGERHLDPLTWGLVPSFTKDFKAARKPINARAETVGTSSMFRAALAKRRCLVPAAAFYEWNATSDGKVPHAIARADGEMLAFAGLWEGWRSPEGDVLRQGFRLPCRAWSAWLAPADCRSTAHVVDEATAAAIRDVWRKTANCPPWLSSGGTSLGLRITRPPGFA